MISRCFRTVGLEIGYSEMFKSVVRVSRRCLNVFSELSISLFFICSSELLSGIIINYKIDRTTLNGIIIALIGNTYLMGADCCVCYESST